LNLFDRVQERPVVAFDLIDVEARRLESGAGLVDGSSICETGDPSSEPGQLGIEPVGAQPHIGEAESSPRTQNPGERSGGAVLARKGAKGALAHHGIEGASFDRELLSVTKAEADLAAEPRRVSPSSRPGNLAFAEVDAQYIDAPLFRQEQRGGA